MKGKRLYINSNLCENSLIYFQKSKIREVDKYKKSDDTSEEIFDNANPKKKPNETKASPRPLETIPTTNSPAKTALPSRSPAKAPLANRAFERNEMRIKRQNGFIE